MEKKDEAAVDQNYPSPLIYDNKILNFIDLDKEIPIIKARKYNIRQDNSEILMKIDFDKSSTQYVDYQSNFMDHPTQNNKVTTNSEQGSSSDVYDECMNETLYEKYTAGMLDSQYISTEIQKYFMLSSYNLNKESDQFKEYMREFIILFNHVLNGANVKEKRSVDILKQCSEHFKNQQIHNLKLTSDDTGLKLNIEMLKEMKHLDEDIFIESLKNVINSIRLSESLKVSNKEALFYTREKMLNNLRNFLAETFREKAEKEESKDLSLPTTGVMKEIISGLLSLAIHRYSFEDLLVLFNLTKEFKVEIPIGLSEEESPIPGLDEEHAVLFSLNDNKSTSVKIDTDGSQFQTHIRLNCIDSDFIYQCNAAMGIISKNSLKNKFHEPGALVESNNCLIRENIGACLIGDNIYVFGKDIPITIHNKYIHINGLIHKTADLSYFTANYFNKRIMKLFQKLHQFKASIIYRIGEILIIKSWFINCEPFYKEIHLAHLQIRLNYKITVYNLEQEETLEWVKPEEGEEEKKEEIPEDKITYLDMTGSYLSKQYENCDFSHRNFFTDGKHICVYSNYKDTKIEFFDTDGLKKSKEMKINCKLEGEDADNLSEQTTNVEERIKNGTVLEESMTIWDNYFLLVIDKDIYFFKLDEESNMINRIDKTVKVPDNGRIFFGQSGEVWSSGELKDTYSFFTIEGLAETNAEDKKNKITKVEKRDGTSYLQPIYFLSAIDSVNYGEKIDKELLKIEKTVIENDQEYLFCHLDLFRGEKMPPMTHKFFKQLAMATQRDDLSEQEIEMLSKLCHFSLKSLKALNISFEAIVKSPSDRKSLTECSHRFIEEENLDISLSLEEILNKGLDVYDSSDMYQILLKLLRELYTPYSDFKKATDENDQTKLNTISQKIDETLKIYDTIFDFVSEKVTRMISDLKNEGQKLLDAFLKATKEESKEDDIHAEALKQYKKGYYDLYSSYSDNSKILDYYRMLLICFSSCNNVVMNNRLNHVCKITMNICTEFSQFASLDIDQDESVRKSNIIRGALEKYYIKFFIWSVCKVGHSLMKLNVGIKEDNPSILSNLLESNLLSGGIENKFLNFMSENTQEAIKQVAIIEKDNTLLHYVSKEEYSDQDTLLREIAEKGRNETVDKMIEYFQWELVRRHFWAKSGGSDGMRVTRCAFALMIKFSQTLDILEICISQFEIFSEDNPGPLGNKEYKEVQKELKECCNIDNLSKLYEKASKMRVWFQNKKKLISIDTQDEAKKKYEEVRVVKEEEAKKSTKEEDSKEEEKITTSKAESKEPEQVVDQSVFDDLKMDIEKEHVKILLNNITEKTRFLLKFSIPRVWNQDDQNDEYLMLDPESGENEMSMNFHGSSLGSKLKSIQRIQSSKGSVRTYEEIDSKEIFNSSGGSVLAFLQCGLPLGEVQKGVEERYIKALNRYCGFRIMNKIMSLELEEDTFINTVNWFCSSLRNNKNKLAHYTNGLIGMGDYLRTHC